jgi:drug/metabolite transporter (DMT)-like permease
LSKVWRNKGVKPLAVRRSIRNLSPEGKEGQPMDLRAIFMGLTFAMIWASAFTSARILVTQAPPLAVSSVRFFIAGVIGVAIARALGQSFRLTPLQWRATLVFGFCQNGLYLGLNFVAMQTVEASLAAIVASTMPLIVAFLGWTVLRDRLPWMAIAGLLLGMCGVTVIMEARLTQGADLFGLCLCILGSLALAIATLTMRNATSNGNMLMVVGLQMFVGAIVLGLVSLLTETWRFDPTPAFWIAFPYTVVFPGLIGTWLWFALVARTGATRAATFHFLTPFFGVLTAAVLLGEGLTWRDVIGVAIVTLGILAVQVSRLQKT